MGVASVNLPSLIAYFIASRSFLIAYRYIPATFNPRIYFNQGYHDAANDAANGHLRELSQTVHDIRHVSPTFNPYYYEGYKAGLAETNYTGNGAAAWEIYRQTLPDEQLGQIFHDVVSSYVATWKPKDRNSYIFAEARKDAAKICGKSF